MKVKRVKFILYAYDLWGNPQDGYIVNDIFRQREVEILARWNPAINDFEITDLQLNRAIGARGLKWDGGLDDILYATDRFGNPVCELRRV